MKTNMNELSLNELEQVKNRIQTRMIMPGIDIFYQNGRVKSVTAKLCKTFRLHPYVAMRQKKASVVALLGGNLEEAWKQAIRIHLHKKRKIDKSIVFVTHVGCSVKQQEWIKNEILKCVPFERVIIQKASFTVACNSGMESIGISYFSM